jgi:hypothetical protein
MGKIRRRLYGLTSLHFLIGPSISQGTSLGSVNARLFSLTHEQDSVILKTLRGVAPGVCVLGSPLGTVSRWSGRYHPDLTGEGFEKKAVHRNRPTAAGRVSRLVEPKP